MSTVFQRDSAFTPAPPLPPPSGPLLWVPLDEVRQAWAGFGAEALTCPALVATSTAFLALSWETSALRHHRMASQAQQRGLSQDVSRWLSRAVQDLEEAVRDWRCVLQWLEHLASSGTPQACSEPVEQVRELSGLAAAQQQRLQHLVGQVRQEQHACRGGQATATAPATGSDAAVAAAAVAQEEEE